MTLLASDERSVALALNRGARSPFLLLGDHAGRAFPRSLGDLGLSDEDRMRHIAWDIGVAQLGVLVSNALDAAFIRQRFSRLVIDCNREPTRPDAIPEVSDGSEIPGNRGLSAAAREARITEVALPYHAAISDELDARAKEGLSTTLISLHSFTPRMNGFDRPWRFGVLHAANSPFSNAVLEGLRRDLGEDLVGDNEPYRMDEVDFTIPHHAQARNLDYLELEVRQDLVLQPSGQAEIATRIASILPKALADIGAR